MRAVTWSKVYWSSTAVGRDPLLTVVCLAANEIRSLVEGCYETGDSVHSVQMASTKKGNPGKFYDDVHQKETKDGKTQTVKYKLVEAIEGTCLSAATKALGWEKHGKDQGYGAYVEGIVIPLSQSLAEFHPDKIRPGELFLIRLPSEDVDISEGDLSGAPGPSVESNELAQDLDISTFYFGGAEIGATILEILGVAGMSTTAGLASVAGAFITSVTAAMAVVDARTLECQLATIRSSPTAQHCFQILCGELGRSVAATQCFLSVCARRGFPSNHQPVRGVARTVLTVDHGQNSMPAH